MNKQSDMKQLFLHAGPSSARLGRTGGLAERAGGPANFALGSASSQLQEVLVTDLPRSFNRGASDRERERE